MKINYFIFGHLVNSLSTDAQNKLDAGTLTSTPVITPKTQNPDGPLWTAWSDSYGCSNNLISFRNFCGFPRRYLLESVRYKECVMRDDVNYPAKIFNSDFVHSRYRQFVTTDADYDNVDFSDVQPTKGDPYTRIENNYRLVNNFAINTLENAADTTSKAQVCDYANGVRSNCKAASVNKLCDPRFEAYAAINGISVADVNELYELQVPEVRAAIPGNFLVFKEEYSICDDPCPKPMPFTDWTCNCRYGSSYSSGADLVQTDGAPSCDCGNDTPHRFSFCHDPDLSDDVTCSTIAADMAADYPGQCTVKTNPIKTDSYMTTNPIIPGFAPLLYETWYGPVFNDLTNWYQLPTGWISPEELDVPWRQYKLVDVNQVEEALKGEEIPLLTDILALTAAGLQAGNSVRVSVSQLINILRNRGVIVSRDAATLKPKSPLSKYATDFVQNAPLGGIRIAGFSDDSSYAITFDNPCHNTADTFSGKKVHIQNFKFQKTRYTLNTDGTIVSFSDFAVGVDEDKNKKAAHEVLRFLLYHFNPAEIGFQQNSCIEVTASLTEWSEWTACNDVCGGIRTKTRQCQTSNGDILNSVNGQWQFTGLAPYSSACFCPGDASESEECGQVCRYTNWSAWSNCAINDVVKNCRIEGEDAQGTQTRTRDLTCGLADRCCGRIDTRECYIPVCPAWAIWAPWSCCSVTCGDGTHLGHRVRTRKCTGDSINSSACPCGGQLSGIVTAECAAISNTCENSFPLTDADPGYFQTEQCAPDNACPVLIEEWSEWSACSVTCGDGVRSRSFTCENNEAGLGVIPECIGDGRVHEEQSCTNDPCREARAIQDTEWTKWSKCPCGLENHVQKRTKVSQGVLLTGIANCPYKPCALLSEWTSWSRCSEECHGRGGTEKRFKNCLNGNWGTDSCGPMMPLEERECTDLPPCPTWSSWSDWFKYDGELVRERTCVNPGGVIPEEMECLPTDNIETIHYSKKLKYNSKSTI